MRNTKSFINSSLRFTLVILTLLLVLTAAGCKGNSHPSDSPDQETKPAQSTETTGNAEVKTDPEETEAAPKDTKKAPEAPRGEYTKADILGSWTSVRRANNDLYTSTLTFNEDGTVERSDRIYYHPKYHPFENETDWFVAPMGYPSDYGYFGLDDDFLAIHYTRSDFDEYSVPVVNTLTISSLDNEKLTLNDSFGVYLKNKTDLDIVALCDALGVDRTTN